MDIHGLQKLTLLDFPGKVACTVFLGGCDLRCPYCHNWELVTGAAKPELDEAALLDFLRKRRGMLDGVAITGGEPLLRDLAPLLREIRALGYAVKLDTNGTHPARLRALAEEGLVDYVAMDVKNSPDRYAETVGIPDFDLTPVRQSVAFLLTGTVDYEFRTTVADELHDEASILRLGAWIAGAKRYFIQPFTDRDTVPFDGLHPPSAETLERFAAAARQFVPAAAIRGA